MGTDIECEKGTAGNAGWLVEFRSVAYFKILRRGLKEKFQLLVEQAISDTMHWGLRRLVFSDARVANELAKLLRDLDVDVLLQPLQKSPD
jgi:hypothetical protein